MFIILATAALFFREDISDTMLAAGNRCVLVIVPSLYFFSVLAAFCVRSGLLELLSAPLERPARCLLRMDGSILMVLLFSQTAGYPIGTQLLQRMHEQGSIGRKEMEHLLCVCFGCGPAFLLGTVGVAVHLPPLPALLLQLSVSLPNFVLACYFAGRVDLRVNSVTGSRLHLDVENFTLSVECAAAAMLKICSMILVFSAVSGILQGCGASAFLSGLLTFAGCPEDTAESLLLSVLEISNLSLYLQQGGSLPMAAALLSFGGFCVHLQNAAICCGEFPWRKFFCIRLVTAVCSYALCFAAMRYCFGGQLTAMLPVQAQYEMHMTTKGIIPVICLLVMSVLLLSKDARLRSLKKFTKNRDNLSGCN